MNKLILTKIFNGSDECSCQYCGKFIAKFLPDNMIPTAEECYEKGNIPIPNFG